MTTTPAQARGEHAAHQIRAYLRPTVASGIAYAQALGTPDAEQVLTAYWQQWSDEERQLAFVQSIYATRALMESHPQFAHGLATALADVLRDDLALAELDQQLDGDEG